MDIVVNYALHLLAAGLLLFVFFLIYSWATPFDEMTLIRQGNVAAALTLGGAMIGFSLTVASGLEHTDRLGSFLGWSAAAAALQLLTYVLVTRLLHMSKQQTGHVYEITCGKIGPESQPALWPTVGYYTLNEIPAK